MGRLAIAAGAAGFLVVGFDILRQVAVDDEAHVGLIDAHPKGDGGDDDGGVVADEGFLASRAIIGLHAGVVGARADTVVVEQRGSGLDTFAGGAVDDARLTLAGAQEFDELGFPIALGAHFVEQVVAIERGADFDRVAQLQACLDVGSDFLGSGGGEGGDRDFRKSLAQGAEHEVVGAEIVTPLGKTVRLIDGEISRRAVRAIAQALEDAGRGEAFRCEVEQVELAIFIGVGGGGAFVDRHRTVGAAGADAVGERGIHLVFHEGDERADDDGAAVGDDGGELVAEGFAAAGGHDAEDVAMLEDAVDQFALVRAEFGEAEGLFEYGFDAAGGRRGQCVHKNSI